MFLLDEKKPKHKGHQVHKEKTKIILWSFSFVTFVFRKEEKFYGTLL